MKFKSKSSRIFTWADGQAVFAHPGRDGELKNIFPARIQVRVEESTTGTVIRVQFFDKRSLTPSVEIEGVGAVIPNQDDPDGVVTNVSVNCDGNICQVPGGFRCCTAETRTAHQEWLATPDGVAYLEEVRRFDEEWRNEEERLERDFPVALRAAEKDWNTLKRRWVWRYIESGGRKSATEAIRALVEVPGFHQWKKGSENLPEAIRRILVED